MNSIVVNIICLPIPTYLNKLVTQESTMILIQKVDRAGVQFTFQKIVVNWLEFIRAMIL
jgi:hypothetical protein